MSQIENQWAKLYQFWGKDNSVWNINDSFYFKFLAYG